MSKKPNRPRDVNQLAKFITDLAVGTEIEAPQPQPSIADSAREGGKKGGRARADKLTAVERARIASNAANIRWAKKPT